jgi:hypothetical protein
MSAQRKASKTPEMIPARRASLAGLLGGSTIGAKSRLRRVPPERIAPLKEIAHRWERRLPEGA